MYLPTHPSIRSTKLTSKIQGVELVCSVPHHVAQGNTTTDRQTDNNVSRSPNKGGGRFLGRTTRTSQLLFGIAFKRRVTQLEISKPHERCCISPLNHQKQLSRIIFTARMFAPLSSRSCRCAGLSWRTILRSTTAIIPRHASFRCSQPGDRSKFDDCVIFLVTEELHMTQRLSSGSLDFHVCFGS